MIDSSNPHCASRRPAISTVGRPIRHSATPLVTAPAAGMIHSSGPSTARADKSPRTSPATARLLRG